MANSPLAVWSVFLSGILVALILLAGFVAAVVISQRRYLKLYRSHARRILAAQEEERAWVAREVHEGAVQWVGAIGGECEAVLASVPPSQAEPADRLRAMRGELRDLATFLRGLAHRLHPPLIDQGGLAAALDALCEEFERSHDLRVEWHGPPAQSPVALKPEAAIALYRSAQEALQNIVKHAESSTAVVALAASPQAVELTVRDTGRGFESSGSGRGQGIGLLSMRERAILAGGSIVVKSVIGEGTEVRAITPILPAQKEP